MVTREQFGKMYIQLCHKAHISVDQIGIAIAKKSSLNASEGLINSLYIQHPGKMKLISVNQGCLDKLSASDVKALLAHELGHINYPNEDRDNAVVFLLQILMIMPLIPILVTINSYFTPVIILCGVFMVALFTTTMVDRWNENYADLYGAKLVGKACFIHMLKSFRAIKNKQDQAIIQDIKDLVLCPTACLKEIGIWLIFKATEFAEYNHMSVHLTFSQRIRRIIRRWEASANANTEGSKKH